VGVDSAVSMIEIATRRTEPGARISWLVDDAERLESCETGSFDGATCQLGLMDIADLDRALRSIHRVLRGLPAGAYRNVRGGGRLIATEIRLLCEYRR
jgi:ubiquinone/menaquinone biosynthesis C-methylase UbiE